MIERQRAIQDALAGINLDDNQKSFNFKKPPLPYTKHQVVKKITKLADPHSPDINCMSPSTSNNLPESTRAVISPIKPPSSFATNYKKLLEDLVIQNFDARCHFVCIPVLVPYGFICKVDDQL